MEIQNLPWYGQLLVFLIVGTVLFGIFYFVIYSPTQDEIASIVAQSERLEEEIRKAEKNESKLEKLKEEKALNEKILEDLKGILPEKKEVSQILRKIQAIASNARLKTSSFNFSKETNREIYLEWPIAISLEGNYHNLGIFFDQVSRLKKIFTIDGLRIAPLRSLSYDYTIQANFTATTYIYREGGKIKKAVPKRAPARRPADPDAGLRPGDV
ncbi:MAG: type 4a pilus biogenesis protein PilO [Acidobacteria bacterium]|nr:type 4a pilus biogenesis protein PilO [Acidobacteriota bacterium]MBU4307403.1 type 4a pilus biogenesis protein PilO [Acidobacteriota bacterium]MCG2811606.1 type 4a pilus biogenesis protein PilO [Candidatus Aminicenantes bacterium]